MIQIQSSCINSHLYAIRPALVATARAVVGGAVLHRVMLATALLLTFELAAPARAQCAAGWVPGVGSGLNGSSVYDTALLPDGDVIVGGDFFAASGVPVSNIARYNPTTGAWSALGSGTNSRVYALAVLPDGDVIAGGIFTEAGGVPASLIARLNPTTGVWSSLGMAPVGGSVNALAVLPDGNVIVGGRGLSTGAGPAGSNIARYSPSTGLWSPLGGGVDSDVEALAIASNGDVLAGGRFFRAGGTGGPVVNGVARFSFNTLTWSALGSGVNDFGLVWAMAELPNGDVIAGGRFASIGGVQASRVARYTPTTGVWSPLGSGVQAQFPQVQSLLVLPGGDLLVGGLFNTAGGVPAANIARYNVSTGIWSPLGSGTNSTVTTLNTLPGNRIIAGGFFTTAGGPVANFVARYSFGPPPPMISTQPSSQTLCPAGTATFTVAASGIAPLTYAWRKDNIAIDALINPSAATDTLILPNVTSSDIASYDVIVNDACGSTTSSPATLTICLGDFNCDGGIDGSDIEAFFTDWEAGNAAADINEDGGIDGSDVEVFFGRWEAGC